MLIYHCHNATTAATVRSIEKKNKGKGMKKGVIKVYKCATNRKNAHCLSKGVKGGRSKKKTVVRRKKNISKKNVKFLEKLGLKVKQQQNQ